jgi:microcystin-dependent protein
MALTKVQSEMILGVVPAGIILPFAGAAGSTPSGYLFCNGAEVSRTTYAALFAVIGTAHGSGDGSTTFRIPDLRGRFIRGTDTGVGRDPDASSRTAMNTGGNTGDAVGTVQGSAFAGHTHTLTANSYRGNNVGGFGWGADDLTDQGPDTKTTSSTGSSTETRPINANVSFIIKT